MHIIEFLAGHRKISNTMHKIIDFRMVVFAYTIRRTWYAPSRGLARYDVTLKLAP